MCIEKRKRERERGNGILSINERVKWKEKRNQRRGGAGGRYIHTYNEVKICTIH